MSVNGIIKSAANNQSQISSPSDPYFKNVTLLLNGENSSNGGQNNSFIDSSGNNLTLTKYGNVAQGSFSPYGYNWSNYLSGSNYLSVASNSNFSFSSGNFTVECWCYIPKTTAEVGIIGKWNSSLGSSPNWSEWILVVNDYYGPALALSCLIVDSSSGAIRFTADYSNYFDKWTHIAMVRNGNTLLMYLNGILVSSIAYSGTIVSGSQRLLVGIWETGGYAEKYVSNVRIVKGTAVYTANFTPSSTPLTAITNTVLLTCQSNSFKDNSINNFTINVNGTPIPYNFSPFAPAQAYSTSINSGSAYFDGSGDYISISPVNSNFDFRNGVAFTIEAWICADILNMPSDGGTVIVNRNGSGGLTDVQWSFGVACSYYGSEQFTLVFGHSNGTNAYTGYYAATPTKIKHMTWTHIAASMTAAGSLKLFINGNLEATYPNFGVIPSVQSNTYVNIGYGLMGTQYFKGYISDLRVTKGAVLYSSSFTPPTAPTTAVTGTQLLCNFSNASIIDASGKNNLETVGASQVSTATKRYGTGSLYFNGSGNQMKLSIGNSLYFGTGDFTVEFWVNPTSTNSIQCVVDQWINSQGSLIVGQWQINIEISGKISFYTATSASAGVTYYSTNSISFGVWSHVALVRSSGIIKAFINGAADPTTLSFSSIVGLNYNIANLGMQTNNSGFAFTGYLDDLRITKGIARYTANFTPPATFTTR